MSDMLANFRELEGIGPATEARLHVAGLYTWTALSEILTALLRVRGVAGDKLRALSEQAADRASEADEASDPGPRDTPRREAFILRIALDEGGRPTHSSATHVRTQIERPWAGWEPEQVLGFIDEQTGLGARTTGDGADGDDPTGPAAAASQHHHVVLDAGKAMGGRPRDVDLVVSTAGMPDVDAFEYRATLRGRAYGARPDDGAWTTLAERHGHGRPPDHVPLRFDEVALAPGLQRLRLDLAVTLASPRRTAPVLELA